MSDSAEKTETKPFDSEYYKWSKQINESKKELERLGVDISPTRIQGEVAEQMPSPSTGVTSSAWNKAGTWEEMDLSKWAMKRIPEILKAAEFEQKGYSIRIADVEKCDGQATYVFVKGKKRPGFDITLKLKWCATCDESSEEAKGTITINDVFFLFLGERADG
ncbi:uncharacterized protein [Blastocystis hominis]|uniref:Activator of Hsp90 ATPase AHSA1-like N-terminal domain-containing protein n=1 Tax=Blastocystis hominis TaxID=12968 RepID=D8LX89_BLAHO|nr:uncharacterized protein [Blastocystis hominis]CBK20884.2 unnamed protein product [Blastocystis hominis]|eukprot:XP_012894932.1 uncharacterized protein [Blastocystis hominis]